MSARFIQEDTAVHRILAEVDASFPERVAAFIDKTLRKDDHWTYRLVSSQLDADRLDYMRRDGRSAGLQGYDFDLPRLLDCLEHLDGKRIAVDRRATAAVELYLVALDKLYSSVYYHHAIRAATVLLGAILQRAAELFRNGDGAIFDFGARRSPVRALFERGSGIDLADYARLGEFHVWALIDGWRDHGDPVLADLATRLVHRRLPKTIELDPQNWSTARALHERALELARARLGFVNEQTAAYYVVVDEPVRTSYKTYDWRAEAADESIWMVGGREKPRAIENERNGVVPALKEKRYFHRLMVPPEFREELDS